MAKLALPTVTLCAAASVNVAATVAALCASLEQANFAECLLFTDAEFPPPDGIRIVRIPKIRSAPAYSEFLVGPFSDHIRSEHCLIVQWDGFVTDAGQWDPAFLDYDYIGARWPQFTDGYDVGNGGFSLRSRQLLAACRDPRFRFDHPEDVAICRLNRDLLEREHAIRFAPGEIADRFSYERTDPGRSTFGFHGVFNMVRAVGADGFWEIYRSLDDPRSAFADYRLLMRQLGTGPRAPARRLRLSLDRLKSLFVG
jgi:hypothetical protein